MLNKIKEILSDYTIFDLRSIARMAGVHSPTTQTRDELIKQIYLVFNRQEQHPHSKKGRPALRKKNTDSFEEIINKIKVCLGKPLNDIVSYENLQNQDDQHEQWLISIAEKLSEEKKQNSLLSKKTLPQKNYDINELLLNINLPKLEQKISTDNFTKKVTTVLNDVFDATTYLDEFNRIRIAFSIDDVFMVKIIKL